MSHNRKGIIARMRAKINEQRIKNGEKTIAGKCCKMAIPGIHSGKCPTRKHAQQKRKDSDT